MFITIWCNYYLFYVRFNDALDEWLLFLINFCSVFYYSLLLAFIINLYLWVPEKSGFLGGKGDLTVDKGYPEPGLFLSASSTAYLNKSASDFILPLDICLFNIDILYIFIK